MSRKGPDLLPNIDGDGIITNKEYIELSTLKVNLETNPNFKKRFEANVKKISVESPDKFNKFVRALKMEAGGYFNRWGLTSTSDFFGIYKTICETLGISMKSTPEAEVAELKKMQSGGAEPKAENPGNGAGNVSQQYTDAYNKHRGQNGGFQQQAGNPGTAGLQQNSPESPKKTVENGNDYSFAGPEYKKEFKDINMSSAVSVLKTHYQNPNAPKLGNDPKTCRENWKQAGYIPDGFFGNQERDQLISLEEKYREGVLRIDDSVRAQPQEQPKVVAGGKPESTSQNSAKETNNGDISFAGPDYKKEFKDINMSSAVSVLKTHYQNPNVPLLGDNKKAWEDAGYIPDGIFGNQERDQLISLEKKYRKEVLGIEDSVRAQPQEQPKAVAGGKPESTSQNLAKETNERNVHIGDIAMEEESGDVGTGLVCHDPNPAAKIDYGKYQFSSGMGMVSSFVDYLRTVNPDIYSRLNSCRSTMHSLNGSFANEWRKLAKQGLLQECEYRFAKQTFYDEPLSKLNPEIAARVKNSRILQEAFFSSCVQHGQEDANRKGGIYIFEKAYKPGMTDEQFLQAIYTERGHHWRPGRKGRYLREPQNIIAELGTKNKLNHGELSETQSSSKVLVAGDSLTEAMGGSGFNSGKLLGMRGKESGVIRASLQEKLRGRPETVSITWGSNDFYNGRNTEYVLGNTKAFIAEAKQAGVKKIVIGTVPPMGRYLETHGRTREVSNITSRIDEYNLAIKQLANSDSNIQVSIVDYSQQLADPNKHGYLKKEYDGDGLHPNGSGTNLMISMLNSAIKNQHQQGIQLASN